MNIRQRSILVAIAGLLAVSPASANFINLTGRGGGGDYGWVLGQIDFSVTVSTPPFASAGVSVPGGPSVSASIQPDFYWPPISSYRDVRFWIGVGSGLGSTMILEDLTLQLGVPTSGGGSWHFDPAFGWTGEVDFGYNFNGWALNGSGIWWAAGPGYGQPTGGVPDMLSTLVAVAAVFVGLLLIRSLASEFGRCKRGR
jgi:hypothetical protein